MPPFVGVAVKVTFVPAQIVLPGDAAMLIVGTTVELTVIVIAFEVTGFELTHESDDVITHVTTSPFINDEF